MKTYGNIIKEIRENLSPKMSRRKLSERIGLSETHLRGIEGNKRETKLIVLRRCAIALGVDEKPLIAAWLYQNLEAVQIKKIISQLPQSVNISDLTKLYDIEKAKVISAQCQKKNSIEVSNPKTAIKMKRALQNCVDFINELEKLM